MDRLEPITPGRILKEDFMAEYGLSANKLARDIDVPPNRIIGIVSGKRAITADTALRLGRYFNIEPQFWLNLQADYDLQKAEQQSGDAIKARVRPIAA